MNVSTELPSTIERDKPRSVNADGKFIRKKAEDVFTSFAEISVSIEAIRAKILYDRFSELAETWRVQTAFFSDPEKKFTNMNYVQIMRLGHSVLRFILLDLSRTNSHWFYALTKITGVNPIPEGHIGNIEAMKDDWLIWGITNDII